MTAYHQEDTIVALSTPAGSGAIGVIRLSGSQAFRIGTALTGGKIKLDDCKTHSLHFARIREEGGNIIDEVVFSVFKGPGSYTGEDVLEISCHGSSFIIENILRLCLSLGARLAQPGEFTMRAYFKGKMDLSQAEAVADLIASETSAAHNLAMNQMRGGFSKEIERLRAELIHFTSLIELELDFGEEDVEFADRKDLNDLIDKILKYIADLKSSFQLGNVLKNGVAAVIAGRPNAGKSTLLNAMVNYDRAIVSDIAGTTRDTIEEMINISGIRFRLIDTAGIRDATDTIEKIGVARALQEVAKSMMVLYLFDVNKLDRALLEEDILKLKTDASKLIVVANKMDSNPYAIASDYYIEGWVSKENFIPISALNQMNIEYLKEVMVGKATMGRAVGEGVIVSNARHFEALDRAYVALRQAREGLNAGVTGDFVAMDIRHALYALGDITGKIDVDEDILGTIFGKFCIGK